MPPKSITFQSFFQYLNFVSNDKIGKFRLFSMLRFVKQMFSFWGF